MSATVRSIGNFNGFVVKDSNGGVVSTISRMVPETNKAWEVGYKAVLGSQLFVDVTVWRSTFVDFISGGLVVADPFTGAKTRAYDPETGALWADASGKAVSTSWTLSSPQRQVGRSNILVAQQIQAAKRQASVAQPTAITPAEAAANILSERKDKSRSHLSKYVVDASRTAANSDGDLTIARHVKDVAAVHSTIWPEAPPQGNCIMPPLSVYSKQTVLYVNTRKSD